MTFTSNVRKSIPSFKDRNPGPAPPQAAPCTRNSPHLPSFNATMAAAPYVTTCQQRFANTELPCDSEGKYDRRPPSLSLDRPREERQQTGNPSLSASTHHRVGSVAGTLAQHGAGCGSGRHPLDGATGYTDQRLLNHRVCRAAPERCCTWTTACLSVCSLCPATTPTGERGERTC